MKKIPYKNLSKSNKIFRVVNLATMFLLCATCVSLALYYGLVYDPNNRIIPSICIAVLSLLPAIIEMIFRCRINNFIFIAIEIYLIFAGLIGSVLNVYYLVGWYDIVIHIFMGYIVAVCGIFVISRLGNYNKMNIFLVAIFCVCFSLAIEVIWEIFEFGADNLFNQTMQGEKLPNYNQPLVWDTMIDLICNTSGAIIFFIHYIVGKSSKYSLGMKFVENNLAFNSDENLVSDTNVNLQTDVSKNCDSNEISKETIEKTLDLTEKQKKYKKKK